MSELKTALALRALRPSDLARQADIKPQQLNNYLNGGQTIGPKMAQVLAQLLHVSEAYLRGMAQTLPVRDFVTGDMHPCRIMSEEIIEHYGVLYTVDHPEVGPLSVILADGVQFTTPDWQGAQPSDAEEIEQYAWVDARGQAAVMLDGLPRLMLGLDS